MESPSDEIAETSADADPERAVLDREIAGLVETAIDALPEKYRLVFLLREIEGLSTTEVADALKVSGVTVKTRFHRARKLIRAELLARARPSGGVFPYLGGRCARMRSTVMDRVRGLSSLGIPSDAFRTAREPSP